jgi:hypothetical protein
MMVIAIVISVVVIVVAKCSLCSCPAGVAWYSSVSKRAAAEFQHAKRGSYPRFRGLSSGIQL